MIKPSSLGGELILRTEMMWIIEAEYYSVEGIREWDVYKQHLPRITAHFEAINAALRRYKAHRIERGLCLVLLQAYGETGRVLDSWSLERSPGASSRTKALEKRRLLLEKRKAVAANVVLNRATDVGRVAQMATKPMRLVRFCTVWYFAYLVFVLVLCCGMQRCGREDTSRIREHAW
nr:hypothetical protein SEVIR_5G377900v2 [Setaria viridis]